MYIHRQVAIAAVLTAMTTALGSAQSITSAHSGTLHYFDGSVSINGVEVVAQKAKFPEIKDNGVLKTGQGRAEILLTPGVFLRVGENTEIKMLDNRLLSTRVELLSGSAMVESDDAELSVKDPAVTIVYKDYEVQPLKSGVFEINSTPGEVKVFKGQASLVASSNRIQVKEGHVVSLSAALLSEKFDPKQADDLYLWTRDRSSSLSAANMASARTLASRGYTMDNLFAGSVYPGLGFNSRFSGGWYFNQAMDMYTYMPFGGVGYNPFGYGFYSPGSIYSYYNPYNYYWYGNGGSRNGGSSGAPLSVTTSFGSQVARLGSVHPTMTSPVRSLAVDGSVIGQRGMGSNGNGLNTAAQSNDPNYAGRGYSAPAASSMPTSSVDMSSSAGRSMGGGGGSAAPAAPAAAARGR